VVSSCVIIHVNAQRRCLRIQMWKPGLLARARINAPVLKTIRRRIWNTYLTLCPVGLDLMWRTTHPRPPNLWRYALCCYNVIRSLSSLQARARAKARARSNALLLNNTNNNSRPLPPQQQVNTRPPPLMDRASSRTTRTRLYPAHRGTSSCSRTPTMPVALLCSR
jgi:hypothetical protein